jgi:hypothetical protein
VYIYFRYTFNVGFKLRRNFIIGAQGKAKIKVWLYGDEAFKLMLIFLLPRAILDNTVITQHTTCRV